MERGGRIIKIKTWKMYKDLEENHRNKEEGDETCERKIWKWGIMNLILSIHLYTVVMKR
jgi:hypothetical protein